MGDTEVDRLRARRALRAQATGGASGSDGLLRRVRWLFALFNVVFAAVVLVELSYERAPAWPDSGIMTAAFLALGAWAVLYYRRDGRGLLLDLAPFVLLAIGGIAAGDGTFILGRLVVALFLQALYRPSRTRLVLLGAGHTVVGQGVGVLIGEPPENVVNSITSALLVFATVYIVQAVASAMIHHERLSRRNAVLTGTTRALLAEQDPVRTSQVVADGLRALTDDEQATATVWRRDGHHLELVAAAGAHVPSVRRAALADLPEPVQEALRSGEPAVLGPEQMAALQRQYGADEPWTTSVAVPVMIGDEAAGTVALGSVQPVDDELAELLRRVADELSLALQLAERGTLLAGVIDHSPDLVAVVDADGLLRFLGPVLRQWTGTDPAQLEGQPVGRLLRHPTVHGPVTPDELTSGAAQIFRLAGGHDHAPDPHAGLEVEVTSSPLLADGSRILNIRDVTERRRLEAEITHRAFHDSVTGLPNRVRFLDALDRALRSGRTQSAAVVLLDLDDFKGINDTHGHAAGDRLLLEIARRLEDTTRGSDLAARLGGDEFALLLDDVSDAEHAEQIVDRVLDRVRNPVDLGGQHITVSASVGIALLDTDDRDEALHRADLAMDAAKEMGKGRATRFHPGMHDEIVAHRRLRAEFETALAKEQFVVRYQPIMDLHTDTAVGVEALVRWQHPERGLLGPDQFIPIAEETGLIVPLGRWVLAEACREVAGWSGAPDVAPPTLSVNLSPVELRSPSLVGDVAGALAASGLQPAQLTLEITETALIEDTGAVSRILASLRELGVRIAIDDFGTGYSSISHLHRLPVDVIKIDREFVGMIADGAGQPALAEAIVRLAGTLQLHTVAEGVEDADQRAALTAWGCTHAQGWLWAPAEAAAEARRLLGAGSPVTHDLEPPRP